MGDANRDPDLDRKQPDPRGASSGTAEAADGSGKALEPAGAPDGIAATSDETENQDATAR